MTNRFAALSALALAAAVSTAPALAQDVPSITVRPLYGGDITGSGYTGPYKNLPGVAMFRNRTAPGIQASAVKLPTNTKIYQEYRLINGNRPYPVLDGWHGHLSEGIPF